MAPGLIAALEHVRTHADETIDHGSIDAEAK
jgi:hypothetical protein